MEFLRYGLSKFDKNYSSFSFYNQYKDLTTNQRVN